MGSVAELEKARKERDRRRFFKRLTVLILAVVLTLGGLYVLRGGMLRVAAGKTADGMMTFLAGETLPATLSINRPQWMGDAAGRIAVADNTTLAIFTRSGRQVASHTLGYQRPAFRAAGGRVLAYDVGSTRFGLYYWGDTLISHDLGEAIYCADLAPGGNIVIGSGATGALSGVTVFSPKKIELFRWSSSELMVSAVAMDESGTRVAFSGLSTEKGEVYSLVSLYKIDQEDPLMRVMLPGEAVVALGQRGRDVIAVSDKRLTVIGDKGQIKSQYDYPAPPMAFAISDKGQVGLVTGDHGEGHAAAVTLFDHDLKVQGEWSVEQDIAQLGFNGSELFIVSGEQFIRCASGKEAVSVRLPEGILALPGKDIYYVTVNQLKKAAAN